MLTPEKKKRSASITQMSPESTMQAQDNPVAFGEFSMKATLNPKLKIAEHARFQGHNAYDGDVGQQRCCPYLDNQFVTGFKV